MGFDPLLLYTPIHHHDEPEQLQTKVDGYVSHLRVQETSNLDDGITDYAVEDTPLHVHDLPLLALKPPSSVLKIVLELLAPHEITNFGPSVALDTSLNEVLNTKGIAELLDEALAWLQVNSQRFITAGSIASIFRLSGALRSGMTSQYNEWLTRVISSSLLWMGPEEAESVRALASARLSENCGRTAQPGFVRTINIPGIPELHLKEPSLTADNLGLKTWGSSYVLGCRLAAWPKYLYGSVLELGAGTGLVGMVACLLGHQSMLTDLPEILDNLRENMDLNEIENGSVAALDWRNPSEFTLLHGDKKYDTVILSDPLYSPEHPPWIVSMIGLFTALNPHSRVLIQVPKRRKYSQERGILWALLESAGFILVEDDVEKGYDDFGESEFIFRMYTRSDAKHTSSS